jgi:hypothetical protein
VITVVVDPFSRLTLVTVVSALPVCDVVEVVEVAGPALSGKTIVVVLDGGAAAGGATSGVWAAAGSADNKRRPNSGTMGFMSVKRLAARFVRQQKRVRRWQGEPLVDGLLPFVRCAAACCVPDNPHYFRAAEIIWGLTPRQLPHFNRVALRRVFERSAVRASRRSPMAAYSAKKQM